jgi:aspartyl-tRNA(Asn)/glutamyl-tRNA(Gln) amidotransferase subunit C
LKLCKYKEIFVSDILTHKALLIASSLAKIDISEQEATLYLQDINEVLSHAQCLRQVSVDGISPTISPLVNTNTPLREDIVKPSLSQHDVLKESSQTEAGHFRVPRTVEG